MSSPAVDPKDLRVSDDERSHVLKLLERATGRGLIDLAEYTERSERVIAARTRGDLNAVLLDLPGLQIAGRSVAQAHAATVPDDRRTPGFSGAPARAYGPPPETLELTGWGSRSFRGRWVVPPLIIVGGFGSSTRLDFSEATLISRQVTVEFRNNYGGSAEFVLPKGGTVRFDALSLRGGHVHNKVPVGAGGSLDLVLTGVKKGGSVVVRYARHGLFSGRR